MYEHAFQYFGLRENPFPVSPDPRFYISTPVHDAALAKLVQGVDARQNFTVLTGEAGTGKTILLNHFLNWLRKHRRSSAYLFHPRLKPVELFDCILRDFGVPHQSIDKRQLLETLSRWLTGRQAMGDTPVVVIDEAQAISVRTLDQLRWLLNLTASGEKLLQIVLVGQPELEDKLSRPELRNLRKRVTCRFSLEPFSMDETSQYVKARLAGAGASNPDIFSKDNLEAIHGYARGIPRTVNLLCEQTLIAGYAAGVKIVAPQILRQVAEEYDLTPGWTDYEERETSSKFTRFLTLVPGNPDVIEPVDSKVVPEPEPVIPAVKILQSPDVEPNLLMKGPEIRVVTNTIVTRVPAATPVDIPPAILPAESNPPDQPGFVAQKANPTRSLGTRLVEQWLRRWEALQAGLACTRDKVTKRYALAMSSSRLRVAAIKSNWAGLRRNIGKTKGKLDEQWVRQRNGIRANLARGGAQLKQGYSLVVRSKGPVLAAIKSNWASLLRDIGKMKGKLDEQWVRQRKDIRANLARGGAQLKQGYSLAVRSKDPVLAAIKSNWAGLHRNIGKMTQKLDEQWVRQRKDIRANLARGGAQLGQGYSLAVRSKDPVLAAIKSNWAGLLRKTAQRTVRVKQVSARTNLGRGETIERFVSYSREVVDSFARDWKQWIHKNTSPKTGALVTSAPNVPHLGPVIVKPSENKIRRVQENSLAVGIRRNARLANQWIASRDRFLRKSKTFMEEPIAAPHRPQGQLSATKFQDVRQTTRQGEWFVRYWKEVRTSFLRDWNQLMSANGSAGIAARKRR